MAVNFCSCDKNKNSYRKNIGGLRDHRISAKKQTDTKQCCERGCLLLKIKNSSSVFFNHLLDISANYGHFGYGFEELRKTG